MNRRFKKVLLPELVEKQLNLIVLPKTAYKKAVSFLQVLTHYFMRDYKNESPFYIYSKNRLEKEFGTRFRTEFLSSLLESKIVLCDNYYSKEARKALGYAINQELIDGSFVSVEVQIKEEEVYSYEGIIPDLYIDEAAIRDEVDNYIGELDLDSLTIVSTPSKKPIEYRVGLNWERKYGSIQTVLDYTCKGDLKLIKAKNNYYVDEPTLYIKRKIKNTEIAYGYVMARLALKDFASTRNGRNGRLDSVFTSMPKVMLNQIKADNGLTELDIKNSQFAIFADILSKDQYFRHLEDVKQFVSLALTGGFYEEIAKIFQVERQDAKIMMMEIIFSSPVLNPTKRKFKEHFPNVYQWATDYKKEHGSAEFAVLLQRRESEMFIDNLLPILNKNGYQVITKHDSIIVRIEEKKAICKLMQEYFDSINFKCEISGSEATEAQKEEIGKAVDIFKSVSQPIQVLGETCIVMVDDSNVKHIISVGKDLRYYYRNTTYNRKHILKDFIECIDTLDKYVA